MLNRFLFALITFGVSVSLIGCDDPPSSSTLQIDQDAGLADAACPPSDPSKPPGGMMNAGGMDRPIGGRSGGETGGQVNGGAPFGGMEAGGDQVSGGDTIGGSPAGGSPTGGDQGGMMMNQNGGMPMNGGQMGGVDLEGGSMMGGVMDTSNMEISRRYDGTYIAAFNSEGLKTALAKVNIENGYIVGQVINRFGERFSMQGFIDQNGVLRIPPLMGDMGSVVSAEGRIALSGIIEGTYLVGIREGTFAGSLDNTFTSRPSPLYDGLYELSFVRDEQEVAQTTLEIKNGLFQVHVVNLNGDRFNASGFVSDDGTLVLDNGRNQGFSVIAEAHIDPDTFHIEGLYSVGNLVGEVRGRYAD